jgi:hypothetical protein
MLLLSYGEVIPMYATHRYSAAELVDKCQKRKSRFEAMTQRAMPMHVFVKHADGQVEQVPEARLLSTCDAVVRYHEALLRDEMTLVEQS